MELKRVTAYDMHYTSLLHYINSHIYDNYDPKNMYMYICMTPSYDGSLHFFQIN